MNFNLRCTAFSGTLPGEMEEKGGGVCSCWSVWHKRKAIFRSNLYHWAEIA
jgi:hypothetical protein